MKRLAIIFFALGITCAATAQSMGPSASMEVPSDLGFTSSNEASDLHSAPDFAPLVALPQMSPELALSSYQQRAGRQAHELAAYSSDVLIHAELPDSSQHGEFELQRYYTAPRTLTFKALRYMGDGFVKTNVIARILQSDVDHVQKDDPAVTAIRPENYKFSYKGTTQIAERTVHAYQVKPCKKRSGLFKGHIYLDAHTGSLVRAEGRVKSPSIFVKKIDFTQDFADVSGFTFPVHMHSEARAAIVGRTVVDITNRDYQPIPAPFQSASASGSF